MEDLIKALNEAGRKAHDDIVRTCAVGAKNHFKESFDNEGFKDKAVSKWKSVKRKDGKKILTQSGDLRNSIKVTPQGNVLNVTSDLPYAKIHNEGGTAGRGGRTTIDKRQFIGESDSLNDTFDKEASKILNAHLKGI